VAAAWHTPVRDALLSGITVEHGRALGEMWRQVAAVTMCHALRRCQGSRRRHPPSAVIQAAESEYAEQCGRYLPTRRFAAVCPSLGGIAPERDELAGSHVETGAVDVVPEAVRRQVVLDVQLVLQRAVVHAVPDVGAMISF